MTEQEAMTTTTSTKSVGGAVIAEALDVIDGALARTMQRELVSSSEVADLLLDLRTLLTNEISAGGGDVVTAADELVGSTP